MSARPKGILAPWQRTLYAVLLGAVGLMAANSIYLVAFTKISSFFMAMLLMHLVLGVLLVVPFLVFAGTHGPKMFRAIRNTRLTGVLFVTIGLFLLYFALFGEPGTDTTLF